MRLCILSDLHLEFAQILLYPAECDIVVLAGDIHPGTKGITWALEAFPNQEVIYVLGNHEYYGHEIPKHTVKLKALATGTNVHVLENDSIRIGEITFFGCTLWTDFKLLGDPRVAGYYAAESMNDYRKIRVLPSYRKLRPLETAGIHFRTVDWLTQQLDKGDREKIAIVSHHAPSPRSLPEGYKTDILYAASASNLDNLVEKS